MVFTLFLFGDRPLKQKIRDIFLVTTVASLPLAAWLIRNIVIADTATDRIFAVHLFSLDHTKQLINALYELVLPISISGWARALHFGAAAALILVSLPLLYRRNSTTHNLNTVRIVLPALCIEFFLTYIVFLVVSISFFDAATPLDARILMLPFLVIIIAGISLAWSLSSALESRSVWYGFSLFVFFSVTVNLVPAVYETLDIHTNGRGLVSQRWRNSDTIASVMSLAKNMRIYSNTPDSIQFLTGRRAVSIPASVDPITLKPNHDYEEQLQVMCREVRDGHAFVVYLNVAGLWYLPLLQELERKCVMAVFSILDDGVIYGRKRKQVHQDTAPDESHAVFIPATEVGR
jgi:hypothetical protein